MLPVESVVADIVASNNICSLSYTPYNRNVHTLPGLIPLD